MYYVISSGDMTTMNENNKTFVTENYETDLEIAAKQRISAGLLNETGIVFFYSDLERIMTKYGEMYRIKGIANKGNKDEFHFFIDASSQRLKKLLDSNHPILIHKIIKLGGRGFQFTRQYDLTIMDDINSYQSLETLKNLIKASNVPV